MGTTLKGGTYLEGGNHGDDLEGGNHGGYLGRWQLSERR
jgi:hypothetical protein